MAKPVKIIHVINRLEALDRDLIELRTMKRNLTEDRDYFSDMSIAFDRQINNLLNERVKLMELKIENPPENLINRDWMEKGNYEEEDERELKSPVGEGPVLDQDQADEIVRSLRPKNTGKREKRATLTVAESSPKKKKAANISTSQASKSTDDDIETYKF